MVQLNVTMRGSHQGLGWVGWGRGGMALMRLDQVVAVQHRKAIAHYINATLVLWADPAHSHPYPPPLWGGGPHAHLDMLKAHMLVELTTLCVMASGYSGFP